MLGLCCDAVSKGMAINMVATPNAKKNFFHMSAIIFYGEKCHKISVKSVILLLRL